MRVLQLLAIGLCFHLGGWANDECEDVVEGEGPGLELPFASFSSVSDQLGKALSSRVPADENLLFSPFSTTVALSLLLMGSEGETREELAELLGMTAAQEQELLEKIRSYIAGLEMLDEDGGIEAVSAVSLWANTRSGFSFDQSFGDRVKAELYDALVASIDFGDPEALVAINSWGERATKGMVPRLLTDLDASVQAILMASLFVRGEWLDPFPPALTREGEIFERLDGAPVEVEMMVSNSHRHYFSDGHVQVVRLLSRGGGYLEVYLPISSARADVEVARTKYLGRDFVLKDSDLDSTAVNLSLPRFSLSDDRELTDSLRRVAPGAFSGGANFARMGSGAGSVQEVRQNSALNVNEFGFEGASVAQVYIGRSGRQVPTMTVNRSFGVRVVLPGEVEVFRGWINEPAPLKIELQNPEEGSTS